MLYSYIKYKYQKYYCKATELYIHKCNDINIFNKQIYTPMVGIVLYANNQKLVIIYSLIDSRM